MALFKEPSNSNQARWERRRDAIKRMGAIAGGPYGGQELSVVQEVAIAEAAFDLIEAQLGFADDPAWQRQREMLRKLMRRARPVNNNCH